MFIKITRNSVGNQYYHLVESYRDGKKVRQRTLLSLGRVEDNKIEDLAEAISKYSDRLCALNLEKDLDVSKTYILGPLLILERVFELCGIKKALEQVASKHHKVEFDFLKIVFTLIAARIVEPCSKLAVFTEVLKNFYPNLVDHAIPLHHIYRAVDLLAEHKDDIEKTLYWHGRDLLNASVDVVLYDLTTLRFESVREDIGNLRRFGFSKEKRSDCTQVVLGLLVDRDGIPLGFEVYPGNTFEGNTLSSIVEKMRKKFKVRRFIFVADRGIFSKANTDALKKDGGEFIVGMKLGTSKKRTDVYDLSNFTKISDDLFVFKTEHNGDPCFVTWSRTRADRDRKVREDIILKIKKKLDAKKVTSKKFVSNTNYQKFIKGLDQGEPKINEQAIINAQKKDGFFAILTNVLDFTGPEALHQYKQLWKIEDAFGEFKGTLKARPIFHWTDNRIMGHLTMCFMALLCEAHLTQALRKSEARTEPTTATKERPLTAALALRKLNEVRAIPLKVQNETLWFRTDINGDAAELFKAIGLRIPPKIISRSLSM